MLKLILERIIVFGLIFALGFAFSSNAGKKYQNLEQNFKNDITQVMDKYNYIEGIIDLLMVIMKLLTK